MQPIPRTLPVLFVLAFGFVACTPPPAPPKRAPSLTSKGLATGKLEIRVLDGSTSKTGSGADAVVLVMNGTDNDVVMVLPIVGLDAKVILASDELELPSTGNFVQVDLDPSGWVKIPAHSSYSFDFALADAYRWKALPDSRYGCWLDYDDTIANRQANKRGLDVQSTAGKLKSPMFAVVIKDRKFDHIESLSK